jgi:hypothetical protein
LSLSVDALAWSPLFWSAILNSPFRPIHSATFVPATIEKSGSAMSAYKTRLHGKGTLLPAVFSKQRGKLAGYQRFEKQARIIENKKTLYLYIV